MSVPALSRDSQDRLSFLDSAETNAERWGP
jgi:hypothetical protein